MYKRKIKLNLSGEDKLCYILSLEREQLSDDYAIIRLPFDDRGILCHKSGAVCNCSTTFVKGLSSRYIGYCEVGSNKFYCYRPVKVNTTSKYRWMYLGWTNIWAAEHVLVSIAFGLWDNIDDIHGKDVCHKVGVTNTRCDNSVSNLFVDTHRFNVTCAKLESAIRSTGFNGTVDLDRQTFNKWCDALKILVEAPTLIIRHKGDQ